MRFSDEAEYSAFLAGRSSRGPGKVRGRKRSPETESQRPLKAQSRAQTPCPGRYRIVVIERRRRQIDPDNLFPKWVIDELVRARYLPDDSSRYVCSIEKRVEVVRAPEEESTTIELWREETT